MRREHTTFTAQVNIFLRWKTATVGLSHARGCTASLDLPKGSSEVRVTITRLSKAGSEPCG